MNYSFYYLDYQYGGFSFDSKDRQHTATLQAKLEISKKLKTDENLLSSVLRFPAEASLFTFF